MKVVLFGATGMIGQGVLRECLLDPRVERVVSIGRGSTGLGRAKLRELARPDLMSLSGIESEVAGFDACFYCVGVSSAGMSESDYRRVTYDMPLAAARVLVTASAAMTFVYVSGAGADSSERGRIMWARVKGQAENALARLPFKAVYVFRPAFVQPLHGIRSRTGWYNAAYAVLGPMYPLLKRIAPGYVTTTEQVGRAMIAVAERGAPKTVLENADINAMT